MNSNTAVFRQDDGRLGVMVRSATSVWVYWDGVPARGPLTLLVTDLAGRSPSDSLDGSGVRQVALESGQTHAYIEDLPAGGLYGVEIGVLAEGEFLRSLGPVSVQTPWSPGDWGRKLPFPPPSHRS